MQKLTKQMIEKFHIKELGYEEIVLWIDQKN